MQNTEISPAAQRLMEVLASDECYDWGNLTYAHPRTIAAAVLREAAAVLAEEGTPVERLLELANEL